MYGVAHMSGVLSPKFSWVPVGWFIFAAVFLEHVLSSTSKLEIAKQQPRPLFLHLTDEAHAVTGAL